MDNHEIEASSAEVREMIHLMYMGLIHERKDCDNEEDFMEFHKKGFSIVEQLCNAIGRKKLYSKLIEELNF